MVILGIETSCDETAAAISKNGEIVSTIVQTQDIHHRFGGVVPEIASREHDSRINYIVHKALKEGEYTLQDLQQFFKTCGELLEKI